MFEKPYVTIDRTPVPVELTETHIVDPIQTPHLNRLGEWTVKFHLDTPTYTMLEPDFARWIRQAAPIPLAFVHDGHLVTGIAILREAVPPEFGQFGTTDWTGTGQLFGYVRRHRPVGNR